MLTKLIQPTPSWGDGRDREHVGCALFRSAGERATESPLVRVVSPTLPVSPMRLSLSRSPLRPRRALDRFWTAAGLREKQSRRCGQASPELIVVETNTSNQASASLHAHRDTRVDFHSSQRGETSSHALVLRVAFAVRRDESRPGDWDVEDTRMGERASRQAHTRVRDILCAACACQTHCSVDARGCQNGCMDRGARTDAWMAA